MPRGPLVDREVRQIVARWVAEGERSPAAIYRALQRELARANEKKEDKEKEDKEKKASAKPPAPPIALPTERTIGRLVKELAAQASPDESEPWSLATAEPDEAAVIMPVLGAILRHRTIGRPWITRGLAKWIVKVAAAAPTLPHYEQYIVAREYRAAELSAARSIARPWVTDPKTLDAFLACRPWESAEAAERYERLIEQGIVGQPIYVGRWWRSILEQGGKGDGEAARES